MAKAALHVSHYSWFKGMDYLGDSLFSTDVLPATEENISRAARLLRAGALVAFPTETVYGLGAAAENPLAMRRLFVAKGRPADHPVIVHLAEARQIMNWAIDIPAAAWKLAEAFWPGPMTLILHRSGRASDLVTGGQATVGLRVPAHRVAAALLREFGGGIAAPSANRFGRVSPTRAGHVLAELTGRVELILDGGPCQVGLESTIIDLSRNRPAILRPGAVTAEQVAAVLNLGTADNSAAAPRVSGGLASHYAPKARVELLPLAGLAPRARELLAGGARVAILSQTEIAEPTSAVIIQLPAGDEPLARELYAALRQADEAGCDVILIANPPPGGLSAAIEDRLRKAAAPREAI